MSLFPAYSDHLGKPKAESSQGNDWLANSSFPTPIEKKTEKLEAIRGSDTKKKDSKRSSRSKKKKKKKSPAKEIKLNKKNYDIDNSKYFIDKKGQNAFLSVKTLNKSIRPRYKAIRSGLVPAYIFHSKLKKIRYFKTYGSRELHQSLDDASSGSLEAETLASKKTEEFNKKLTENPNDISTWVDFVKFQDEFYKYQHITYKSAIERERAAAHRKLSILDRAVTQNPDNTELQALWLKVGTAVLPSEEMSKRIEEILEESGGTMILWLGLMTTTQYSLARCTVPSVSQLYEKLLLNFQNSKNNDANGYIRDKNVLELLFHYGRFLDNCGQWETLWTIIKVNLQFNTEIKLNFDVEVDEKVKKLEEEVVKEEKRAVWQLWSQLERIREGLHFLPNANSIDYPQRCVAPENVVNFTWHFHQDLHFQLIISFIMLLKVPLLPSTHTILKILVPNSLTWIFDSPEFMLSSVLASPAVNLHHSYLSPLTQLSRGPQYLRKLHGQQEFLDLINYTFEACLKGLEGRQKIALGVWWLRFKRWIHLLSQLNLASVPDSKKTVKNFFKDFLANEENRENLLYYIEYCLLQYNQGNTDTCIKALKTLISSRPPLLAVNNKEERDALMAVYKTLCEVLIGTNQRQEAINLLINLGNGATLDSPVTIHLLLLAEKKFKQMSIQLIQELDSETDCSLEDLQLPNFISDFISCYLWLIALTKTSIYLKSNYDEFFTLLQSKNNIIAEQIRESLWETILTITWNFEKNNLLYVKDILQKFYSSYPQNTKILHFMADNALESNRLWLTIKKTFLSPPSTTGCVFLICVGLDKFYKDQENFQNRLKNLFQDLALVEGKLSSIIHCLRLRFLFEYDNSQLDVAQLQALESCPWNKSIYNESILLLPAKLMQLTDVLVEKELKIHITPDEIQEMRD